MRAVLIPPINFQIPTTDKINHISEPFPITYKTVHARRFEMCGERRRGFERAAAAWAAELVAVVVLADVGPDLGFAGDGGIAA